MTGEGSSPVVVDASIVIKWLTFEKGSNAALELLRKWVSEDVAILAPPLLLYEVANVLHQRVRRGQLNSAQARSLMGEILAFPVTYDRDPEQSIDAAMRLADDLGLSAACDAAYLALADRVRGVVWTADRRFGDLAGRAWAVNVLADN